MALDPGVGPSVARWVAVAVLAGAGACRPVVQPEAPGDEPTPPRVVKRRPSTAAPRPALIGEMCPQGAAGRPGLAPLATRDLSWSSDHADLVSPLQRGTAAQFAVLAVDGRKAGVFSAVGVADVGSQDVAIGSYMGAPPCSRPAADGTVAADATCVAAARGCGLAVAALGPPGGSFAVVEAPDVTVGGACRSGDSVVIDVDGDGTPEVFPLATFLDPVRAPADEVTAAAVMAGTCPPSFSLFGLEVAPEPGVKVDARLRVQIDVLGVLDVDGDGRREVVIGLRYSERRTVAVYSAMASASRLELVGESMPWGP